MPIAYGVNVAEICIDIDEYDIYVDGDAYQYGLYIRAPWLSDYKGMIHSEVARWVEWSGSGEVDQSHIDSDWNNIPNWWYATN